jgi:hypothetical protein
MKEGFIKEFIRAPMEFFIGLLILTLPVFYFFAIEIIWIPIVSIYGLIKIYIFIYYDEISLISSLIRFIKCKKAYYKMLFEIKSKPRDTFFWPELRDIFNKHGHTLNQELREESEDE